MEDPTESEAAALEQFRQLLLKPESEHTPEEKAQLAAIQRAVKAARISSMADVEMFQFSFCGALQGLLQPGDILQQSASKKHVMIVRPEEGQPEGAAGRFVAFGRKEPDRNKYVFAEELDFEYDPGAFSNAHVEKPN